MHYSARVLRYLNNNELACFISLTRNFGAETFLLKFTRQGYALMLSSGVTISLRRIGPLPSSRGNCSHFSHVGKHFLAGQHVFLSLSFLHTRSSRLFLQTKGCCTYAAANTLEQEATVSMKVHEMEADSAEGKQYFGKGSFCWPIRLRGLDDLALPLPAFMRRGLLRGTQ